jgi:hypothetical protein
VSFNYANVKSKEKQFGLIIINLKAVIYIYATNYAMILVFLENVLIKTIFPPREIREKTKVK